MRRITLSLAALAVVLGACSSSTPASNAAPSIASSTAPVPGTSVPATASPTPSPSPVELTANVVFDGKACTWTGLTDVPRNAHLEITFTNTAAGIAYHGGAALSLMAVKTGTTWTEVAESAKVHTSGYVPPFVNLADTAGPVLPGSLPGDFKLVATLRNPQYLAMCFVRISESDIQPIPVVQLYTHER